MPTRPRNHVVADRAVADVTKIWIERGCACDRVGTDYGEDLIVQPVCREQVDPFRLFVQVKGTESLKLYRQNNDTYIVPVKFETFFKWARSSDLTVVILWEVNKKIGFWVAPEDGFDNWSFQCGSNRPSRVTFSGSKPFDALTASKIIWKARARHYEKLILAETARMPVVGHIKRDVLQTGEERKRKNVLLLAFELMLLLGFVDSRYYFNPEVAEVARYKARELALPRFDVHHFTQRPTSSPEYSVPGNRSTYADAENCRSLRSS